METITKRHLNALLKDENMASAEYLKMSKSKKLSKSESEMLKKMSDQESQHAKNIEKLLEKFS